jgi:hypothetical protein
MGTCDLLYLKPEWVGWLLDFESRGKNEAPRKGACVVSLLATTNSEHTVPVALGPLLKGDLHGQE